MAKRSEEVIQAAWTDLSETIERWQAASLDGADRAAVMGIQNDLSRLGADFRDVYAADVARFTMILVRLRTIGRDAEATARQMSTAVEHEAATAARRKKKDDKPSARVVGIYGVPDSATLAALQVTQGRNAAIKRNQFNVYLILSKDPKYANKIRQNELRGQVEIEWEGSWTPVNDAIEGVISNDITARYMIDNPGDMVHKQLAVVASEFKHNPVCAWLSGLKWDGKRRVHRLLLDYFDAKVEPGMESLAEGVSVCFMVSAVARAFRPGCKVDTVLVLQGPEGALKSTALATLFREAPEGSPSHWWFRDGDLPKDFQGKDMKIQLRGPWCCEIQEIDRWTMSKDLPTIRSFITTPADSFRAVYGKNAEDVPRRFVFVGTCNENSPLDDSENRRFWVYHVGRCRLLKIAADRAQLWAEAVSLFSDKTIWHLNDEQKRQMNRHIVEFRAPDPWITKIADWADSIDQRECEFSVFSALEAVGVKGSQADVAASRRMAKVLRELGFSQVRSDDPKRKRLWSRTTSDKPHSTEPLI